MTVKIILTYALLFIGLYANAQKPIVNDPILSIYKILSNESLHVKDSVAIYALNFQLSISKTGKGTVVTKIAANDSLAFSLFPSYKKLSAINFSPIMGGKTKLRLIIPILISGSSPEKIIHQDKHGNPLIDLQAALNAAYALYRPFRYDNLNDWREGVGFNKYKDKSSTWEAMTLNPLIVNVSIIK